MKEKIPIPPMSLQEEITEYFRAEQSVRGEIEKQISQILEYRGRLIADVVTGQVDVRGWVPSLDDVVTDEDLAALGDEETQGEEEDGDD